MPASVKAKNSTNRLANYTEELADGILEEMLSRIKGITFSTGDIRDIKALALNRLWPMYTTSDAGRDFLKKMAVEDDVKKDIVRELKAAIDIVRSNPRG